MSHNYVEVAIEFVVINWLGKLVRSSHEHLSP